MKYFIPVLFIALVSYSFQSKADYLNIAANSGSFDGDCDSNTDGTAGSGGSSCTFMYPIYLLTNAGYEISSVKVYYYDNSGSASISVSLLKESLSTDSYSTIDSDSSTTTSSSLKYLTLSGATLTSSYAYFIQVTLNYGTELRGIKIYYY